MRQEIRALLDEYVDCVVAGVRIDTAVRSLEYTVEAANARNTLLQDACVVRKRGQRIRKEIINLIDSNAQ